MIDKLVRKNIRNLAPYSSARDEFQGSEEIFLDANENPYGTLNRYPDPYQRKLKQSIAGLKNVQPDQIFIGNGSDEVIDLLFRLFCEPGKDEILIFPPTYGMYSVSANINDVSVNELPLTDQFQLDKKNIQEFLRTDKEIKLCFVCSPNNPTGNSIQDIEWLCEQFPGIVIVDEAYIDFSRQSSMIRRINDYKNLVVTQTFSKAWALASARVGVAFTNKKIIGWLNKIKPPYNVSKLNQQAAFEALQNSHKTQQQVAAILQERKKMRKNLETISFIEAIYPSDANFLFMKVDDATQRYNQLISQQVIIRNRTKLVNNCLRITIGTPKENKTLLNALKTIE